MIKLYVIGSVGNLGTKVLIDEKHDELAKQFNQEFITHIKNQIEESLSKDGFNPSLIMSSCRSEYQHRRGELCEPAGCEILDWEVISKGGVLASLWKLCDRNKWGLKYSLRKIPILQGTVEVANHFDINPYRLLTKNSYLIACESVRENINTVGDDILSSLVGANANIVGASLRALTYIGDITNEKKRVRTDGETEAFLTKDYKDEIDKIIEGYTKKNKW